MNALKQFEAERINVSIKGPDSILIIVPREEIEANPPTKSYLEVFVDRAAETVVKERKPCTIEIIIDGYNRDSRELYEIPEVCEWARKEYRLLPGLSFFLTDDSRLRFCGWLCGSVTKDEIVTDSFLEKLDELRMRFIVDGVYHSESILRDKGADESLLKEIYLKQIARAKEAK